MKCSLCCKLLPLAAASFLVGSCSQEEPILQAQPFVTPPTTFLENWELVQSWVYSGTTTLPEAESAIKNLYGGNLTSLRTYPSNNECIIHDPPTELILLHIYTPQQLSSFLSHLIDDPSYVQKAIEHRRGTVLALGSSSSAWILMFFDQQNRLIEAFGRAAPDYPVH